MHHHHTNPGANCELICLPVLRVPQETVCTYGHDVSRAIQDSQSRTCQQCHPGHADIHETRACPGSGEGETRTR